MASPLAVSDKFVSAVLGPTLIILFLALALPVSLIAYVLFQIGLFTEPESTITLRVIDLFHWFRGVPETVGGPLLQVLPAVVAAICLAPDQTRLTWVGRAIFVIVIYIIVAAVVLILLINPDSPDQRDNISQGSETLKRFSGAADYSLGTALVYLGLLTGLSVKVTKTGGG